MDSYLPLVSIVTPVFNGSKYITELITSVLDQDYPNIEHIIIDDGSNDNGLTVEILKGFPHLRWWSRPNKGQYATLNDGIAACTGEIITVICADDKYASRTALSTAVRLLEADPNCDAVYGDTIRIDEEGRALDNEPPRSAPIWLFRYYPGVAHCSLLVRRRLIVDRGIYFDETFTYVGDYDWIIRLIRAGCRFKRLREPIAMYRLHPTQLSLVRNPARVEELRRIAQRHGQLNPVIGFFVNKWWRMIKLKNLFLRRGFHACFGVISLWLSHAKDKQEIPLLKEQHIITAKQENRKTLP